ncbi:hypothetical protein [Phenylobacterium sp.]|jgi:hypothetical protein|uniref:hypothetical protein n=1 Tax=Phenylobacterium sp. TaxID=1871053 RepID=UPI002E361E3E|nr:hypothetical protein [Phenylobacterium sp.]HEX2560985.1 hypothetical protein [Phenylobacterium sp.]
MAPRLKVFVTSDGLTDYVVAASSKPKALAAWGVHQDLFKTGAARETDDPALVEAALARPGEVLRRPAGSRETLAKLKPAKAPRPKKGPSPAALKRVADLEARLASLQETHETACAEIAAAREELNAREALEARNYAAQRDRLEADLAKARKALR